MADYTLYSYFRSSCSARLRIALNLKGISFKSESVNLLKNEQLSEEHRKLNPSGTVPLLVSHKPQDEGLKIGQSVAGLEYLEEVHPETPILPPASDPAARAIVRALSLIVAADTQPVTNLKIMKKVKALGGSAEDWNKELMAEGLRAYEATAKEHSGKYSYGDNITMADVCLMPAVWNAERYGVDVSEFPTVSKIVKNLGEHPAIVKSHYFAQPDCPEDLRKK